MASWLAVNYRNIIAVIVVTGIVALCLGYIIKMIRSGGRAGCSGNCGRTGGSGHTGSCDASSEARCSCGGSGEYEPGGGTSCSNCSSCPGHAKCKELKSHAGKN